MYCHWPILGLRTNVAPILSLLLLAGPAAGEQPDLEIGTSAGVFMPASDLLEQTDPTPPAGTNAGMRARHTTDVAVAGRLTLWLSRRIGLEAIAMYSFSDLATRTDEGNLIESDETGANVVAGAARGVFRIGTTGRVSADLLGGLGFLSRSGMAYNRFGTESAVALNLGARVNVHLTSAVSLSLALEDYVNAPDIELLRGIPRPPAPSPTRLESTGVQHDFVLLQTLTIRLTD